MIIKRQDYDNSNYTIIDNSAIRDISISLTARGLLHYMLSCSQDWKFSIEGLCKGTNTKFAKLNACIKELTSIFQYSVKTQQSLISEHQHHFFQ